LDTAIHMKENYNTFTTIKERSSMERGGKGSKG
jgi:hypothetical protein